MLDQFSRTRMMFGGEAMQKLARSRVAVFGIGGVGGFAAEALARSGIGALDLVDDDKICLTNLNRQIFATHKTVGRYKVDAAAERIADINPACKVTAHKLFFLPETQNRLDFSLYDYVVDAIDTVTGKIAIAEAAARAGVPVVSTMGAGNKVDPSAFEVADIYQTSVCPLARVMRRELKKRGVERLKVVYSKELPLSCGEDGEEGCRGGCICPPGTVRKCTARRDIPASNAFVPPVAGLIAAGEVVKDLIGYGRDGGIKP